MCHGGGRAVRPPANADDLKDRQKQVEQKIEHAHSDLEDSSWKLRNATLRLQAARKELDGAKADLAAARTELAAARVRDQEMKVKRPPPCSASRPRRPTSSRAGPHSRSSVTWSPR